jgi:hypothetical protein
MLYYAVIDSEGNILRQGVCSELDFDHQGPIVVKSFSGIDASKHYYKNGKWETR